MSSKSVLITGAAGFIGSHLTDRCLSLGWHVTAVDSFTDYYDAGIKRLNIAAATENPNCDLIEADLLDLDLEATVADASVVFHLAAQPGVRASWDAFELYQRQNVDATHRLLHAARGLSPEKLVIASSSSIYGDAEALPTREDVPPQPVSPYGVTKVAAEQLASVYWRSFRVPTVCLRYFTVYGPRQRPDMAFSRLISKAIAGEPFEIFGDGRQTRDFTFVEDAVAGTVAAARYGVPGATYNIGGGSRRSMNDVLDRLSELMGTYVDREYSDRQVGDARDTAADIGRASSELGYNPEFDLSAGLAMQLEWQRANLAAK